MNYVNLLYKKCKIKPLENLEGIIIAVFITKKGVEYQVRYYIDGRQEDTYFLDFEIELIEVNE